MTTPMMLGSTAPSAPALGSAAVPLRVLLRLEALFLLAAASAAYFHSGYGVGRFFLLFLVPDVSLLGYLGGARLGARVYNLGHSTTGPLVLLVLGLWTWTAAVPFALIWLAHIGFDRALGYGLKLEQGFRFTHLGRIGRD